MSLQFLPQETSESCVPACLRMVLAYWGIEVEEAILRVCCQTNRFGSTFAETAVCAQSYGLIARTVTDATWGDLCFWLENKIYPIVSINLFPLDARWAAHAVVIETADNHSVTLLDPLVGQRTFARAPFEQAWQMRRRKAVLIQK